MTLSIDILKKFCSQDDYDNRNLLKPFSLDEFTYATNGHIGVRVPLIPSITNKPPMNPCSLLALPWTHALRTGMSEWMNIPAYTVPEKLPCQVCDGLQKETCLECGMDGMVPDFFRVELDPTDTVVNGFYLELIKMLPGEVRLSVEKANPLTCISFVFDGGVGLLMPMRPNSGRIS